MKQMKKLSMLAVAVSVALSILGAAGCGSQQSSTSGGSQDKVEIRFAHWRGEDSKVFKGIIEKFEQENPGISVTQSVEGSEQYKTKIQAELQGSDGPDVFTTFPGADFANLVKAKSYTDLTDVVDLSAYNQDQMAPGKNDNKQLAIPYQLVYNDPVYNKAVFEKLGVEANPKDWNAFLALCQKLKDGGVTPIVFDSEIGFTQFTYPMLMNNMPSADALVKVEKGELKLTDEWFVKTLRQFKELNDKGYFQKDVLGTKKANAAALFAQEKGAMLAQGSFIMSAVKEQNPKIKQGLIAPITTTADQKKYDGIHNVTFMLGINAKSKHQEAAQKFIKFLLRQDIAAIYANGTDQFLTVPGVQYESDELKEQAKWAEGKKTLFLPRSTLTIREVENAINNAVSDVIGGSEPEAAAQKAQDAVDLAIEK